MFGKNSKIIIFQDARQTKAGMLGSEISMKWIEYSSKLLMLIENLFRRSYVLTYEHLVLKRY